MGKTPVRIAGRARLEPATSGSCHSSLTVRANAHSRDLLILLQLNPDHTIVWIDLTIAHCSWTPHQNHCCCPKNLHIVSGNE